MVIDDKGDAQVGAAAVAVGREDGEILALVSSAEALTIETVEQLASSSVLLSNIKDRQKRLTTLRRSITMPMDEAKKRVLIVFQPATEQLEIAERTLKEAVLSYTQKQERLRREEQDRLNEVAVRERARLERLAEKQREADRDDRAEVSIQRAEEVTVPVVAPVKAPSGEVHVRTTWSAEVTNLLELIRACAKGKQPTYLLQPNTTKLNEMARAQKSDLTVPGVRAVSVEGVAARSRA